MAAYRSGIKTVIIPAENESDLEEIDSVVKDHVHFEPVEKIDQVLKIALTKVPTPKCSEKAEAPKPIASVPPVTPMQTPERKPTEPSTIPQ